MKYDLSEVTVEELLAALLMRTGELLKERNWLIPAMFKLRGATGPVICIDGIPWRHNDDGEVELMALQRCTGPFPEKLVLIGGTINKNESLQNALERHFRDDFGVEIEMSEEPFCMSQYRRDGPDSQWMQDPGKDHVVSPVYFVQIKQKTPIQSLQGDLVKWFSKETMPPDKDFGYATERLYYKAFASFDK